MLVLVDDLLSIGEFSERCGLSAKMLRSYADAGLLTPAAVDRVSGYRYYSPGQLHDASVVAALRQAGVSVAEIRDFVEHPSAATLDDWERRLEEELVARRDAFRRARELVVFPIAAPAAIVAPGGAAVSSLRSWPASHIGRVREHNEDVIVTGDRVVVVADGMGGAPGGALAARIAADEVRRRFPVHGRGLADLRDAVLGGNAAVWERARTDDDCSGMGTTICAAAIVEVDGGTAIGVAHVGDSRAYLVRGRELQPLTDDHTVVGELVRRGELEPADVSVHPHRHVLTRVLGMAPVIDVDTAVVTPEPGDRLLLCTDGLSAEVDDASIAAVLDAAGDDPETAAADLVAAALAAGGRDNVSVVVVEVGDGTSV